MALITTEAIRAVALVGHAGAGKTTLAEALLYRAGAIPAMGSIERGTTVCDFDPLEKQHQHSLYSAVAHFEHQGTRIHLVDTPGYPDFLGQAISCLPAAETVIVVVNAQTGIELTTTRMMNWAARRRLCRMIVVNKIDAENTDLPALLNALQETFGKECLPINLPAAGGMKVVDCFFNPAGESDFSSVEQAHRALIDQVVEVDEELMALYLEQGDIDPGQLHAPFEKALREGHLVPICFASARTGVGVPELLDIFIKLLPNPTEGNPRPFIKGEGPQAEEFRAVPDPDKHVVAHVFKVSVDPFVGKLGVFKVHQGTITKDSQLFIGDARKPFKVGHLFMLRGKEHIEVERCIPGDIGAVAKVEEIGFDAVLHDHHDEDRIHLQPLEFPNPIYGLAIDPVKRGDEQRLWEVLTKLASEDPCLRVERLMSTNETVVWGLGELHLRTLLERMTTQYKLEVKTRPPRIEYRETITAPAEGHHRHKKQTGGAGQFGEVFLRIEPLPRGTGFQFVDEVKGGAIPSQFIPAVEKGVQQVMETGAIAGYPMQDVRVVVYDGKSHPVDGKEVAFITAGKKAFLDAVMKARPIVLEPIVRIEITVPEANMGDVAGDISSKRGQVTGTQSGRGGMVTVTGLVPLSELNNYQSRLKSLTGGAGSYSVEFSHYEPVPPNVQQQLVAQHKAPAAED
ncbi:elongation factor G [Pelomicrobium sp.]|jgi:elongation factor G|uniref:elongation factor G n=1 Tax=Pelomicrobium sp. TaxID=2815319 RepID=UPI002FDD76FA